MENSNNDSQIKKGILEIPILLVLSQKLYVSEILKALEKVDLFVPEGTIYPILSRLTKAEFVTYSWQESKSGPPRKYFLITTEGKKYLQESLDLLKNLTKSIDKLKTK